MAAERSHPSKEHPETPARGESIRPIAKTAPPSELARRARLLEETFKLRDAIGPVGLSTSELLSDPEDEGDA
jgi:hypothetical protein